MTIATVPTDVGHADGGPAGGRLPRRFDTHAVFWAATVVTTVVAVARNGALFTRAQYPFGDAALNGLLVDRAEHFQQLVGNYSRVGFHHPGPALLYVLAIGQGILHDLLHIVPSQYNGQVLAAVLYVAVFIGLTTVSLYRMTRSRLATAISFGVVLLFAAQHGMIGNTWFPYLYMPAFLLFVVAAAGVAAGRTSEIVLLVLGGGMLVHGHVSFAMFVSVTAIVAAAGWVFAHRRLWRLELTAHRRGLFGAAALLVLFLLPMIVETIVHYPGQWALYRYYVDHGQHAPRTAGQVVHFASQFWGTAALPVWLSIAAAAGAVALTATETDPARRRGYLALYGMIALQVPLMLVYVQRGVDILEASTRYVGFFFMTMPLLVLAAVAGQLWARLAEAWPVWTARLPGPVHHRLAPLAPAALVVTGLVLASLTAPLLRLDPAQHKEFPELISQLRHDPDRADRPVEFVPDARAAWVVSAGLGLESQREGLRWCLRATEPIWTTLFTGAYTCGAAGSGWVVHVGSTSPRGARVIWQGSVVNRPTVLYQPAS